MPHGLARIDDPSKRMFGYYAYATIDGRTIKTFYSDRRYGGRENALSAAEAAIGDKLEDQTRYLALKRRYHRRTNSPGDVPGVNRVPKAIDDSDGYWIARWHDHTGKRRSRKFSVKKLGEREAYEQALKTRLHETMDERSLLSVFRTMMADFRFERPA